MSKSLSHEDLINILFNPDSIIHLGKNQIRNIIDRSKLIILKESMLLQIPKGKMLIIGDLHGDFGALKQIADLTLDNQHHGLRYDNIVFLGDYIDRGGQQVETINFLLILKLLFPNQVVLLRGNHEDIYINSEYGFKDEVQSKCGPEFFLLYNELFSILPLAAKTWNQYFLVHGGIPKSQETISTITDLPRGQMEVIDDTILQLLWNDPNEHKNGFTFNIPRGNYLMFGEDVFLDFLQRNHLKRMIRAHEYSPKGYKYLFNEKLLTVFSSPAYADLSDGAVAELTVDSDVNIITLLDK